MNKAYKTKHKIECDDCVLYLPLNHRCSCLDDNADDRNGFCKFYKSKFEYTMQYNKDVAGYVPVKRCDIG